jgi:hypothetical protein
VVLGMLERIPGEDHDPMLDVDEEEPDEAGAELREIDYRELAPEPRRRHRRRQPGGNDYTEEDRP